MVHFIRLLEHFGLCKRLCKEGYFQDAFAVAAEAVISHLYGGNGSPRGRPCRPCLSNVGADRGPWAVDLTERLSEEAMSLSSHWQQHFQVTVIGDFSYIMVSGNFLAALGNFEFLNTSDSCRCNVLREHKYEYINYHISKAKALIPTTVYFRRH